MHTVQLSLAPRRDGQLGSRPFNCDGAHRRRYGCVDDGKTTGMTMMARRDGASISMDARLVIARQHPGTHVNVFPYTSRFMHNILISYTRTLRQSRQDGTQEESSSNPTRRTRSGGPCSLCTRNIGVPCTRQAVAARTDSTAYLPSVAAASLFVVRATTGASILNGAPGRN